MRKTTVFLCLITILMVSCKVQQQPCTSFVPEGYLLRSFPYTFKIPDTISTFATFDGSPVFKQGNLYELRPFKNGNFKIFKVVERDTVILLDKQIKVQNPNFVVRYGRFVSGESIERESINAGSFSVSIYNNNISLSIPIVETELIFQENNSIRKIRVDGNYLPESVCTAIKNSQSSMVVFDMKIKLLTEVIHIPQSVFYIK